MPTVSGPLKLVTNKPALVREVLVRSEETRPHGGGALLRLNDSVKPSGGRIAFECLPGLAVLEVLQSAGPRIAVPIMVSDGPSSQSLEEVMRAASLIDGRDADALADIVKQIQNAVGDAGSQATAAARSASSAASSESAAARSASAAKSSESGAKTSEQNAAKSASAAASSASAAKSSESGAKTSEQNAAKSASAAAQSAQSARADADRVATIAGSTRWVGTKVEVNGKLSPDLKGEKGDKGDPGRDGEVSFEALTPAQRESLVGERGPAGERGPEGPQGPQGPAGTTSWDALTGKPTVYPTDWARITGKPGSFPPEQHRHTWSEIDRKPNLASATHTHTVADVSDISAGVRSTLKNGNANTAASSAGAVSWGRGAKATNTDAVALGYDTQASGVDSAALGSYSKVTQQYHVVVGVDATDAYVSQQRGTVIIGKTGAPVIIAGRNVVSELDSLGQQVQRIPDAAYSNDIGKGYESRPVKTGGDGKIFTYTPVGEVSDPKELVSKGYVDSATANLATKTDLGVLESRVGRNSQIKVVTTLPADVTPGVLYVVTEG